MSDLRLRTAFLLAVLLTAPVGVLATGPEASAGREPLEIPADELEDLYLVLRPESVAIRYDAEARRPDERVFVPGNVGTLELGPEGKPRLELRHCRLPESLADREAECWRQLQPQRPDYLAQIGDVFEIASHDRLLTVLDLQGWELNPAPIAVWRRNGENLLLEGVGLPVLRAGLSSVEIRKAVALGENELLVLLKTWGGDGGEMWESLVVGRWLLPDQIQWLYELGDCGGSWEEVEVDYKLSDDFVLGVRLPPSDSGCATYPEGLDADVDLRALMDLLDRGRSVVGAHRQLGLTEMTDHPH